MKEDFQKFIAEFIKNSKFPNREYLPALWIKAESALEIYPDQYPWIIEPADVKPEWVVDIKSLNTWYWSDIVKRVNAVTFIYSLRLHDLFLCLENALCGNAILLSALILRSLLENVASLNWSSEFIVSRLEGLDTEALNHAHTIDEEFENELIRMTHGSRFNWKAYLTGNFEELVEASNRVPEMWHQTNILSRIDKLAKQTRYDSLRLVYDHLCESVHPNLGSNLIYVREEEQTDIGVRILLGSPQSSFDTIEFLEPLTGALLSCCQITHEALPKITYKIEPLSKWCQRNYIYYVKKEKGTVQPGR